MGNVLAPYNFTFQGGIPQGTDPESYGPIERHPVGDIFLAEDFSSYVLGSDPDAIAGFSEFNGTSVISDDLTRQTVKDVSKSATTTEWANGFVHTIPSDLVEGDEAWIRMRIWLPVGSDLDAPGEGGHLKWFRWRTSTDIGGNAGFSDIYYDETLGEWKYIKETVDSWSTLAIGVGGPFDIEYGKWIDWELYTKFSSTVGIVRMWKDGIMINELLNEQTLTTATDTVKDFYFRTYWNGGIPKQQDWHYDRVDIALNGAGRTDSTELQTDLVGNKFIGKTL
jgi:hypothetical protein